MTTFSERLVLLVPEPICKRHNPEVIKVMAAAVVVVVVVVVVVTCHTCRLCHTYHYIYLGLLHELLVGKLQLRLNAVAVSVHTGNEGCGWAREGSKAALQ